MSTGTTDVDEIRRQMAQIRRELHEDVRGVVATAEAVTDWRRYITAYPWAAVGAAFVLGYLVVPKRHKPAATGADLSRVREAVESTRQSVVDAAKERIEPKKNEKIGKGILGAVFGMVAPVALRAAQGYAMKFLENWIMQQQIMQTLQAGPPPFFPGQQPSGPGPGPARPGGPRPQGPGPAMGMGPGSGPIGR